MKNLRPYPAYKPTGLAWLPEVPREWETVSFKSLFRFGKGLMITKDDLTKDGCSVISYGQIHAKTNSGFHLDKSLLRFVPEKLTAEGSLLHEGDIAFADTSEDIEGCGNCVLIDTQDRIYAGYHTLVAKAIKPDCSRFLAFLFQTPAWREQIYRKVNGVKVYSVTQKVFSGNKVCLPPPAEQEAIVAYLDEKTAKIDRLIELKEREIKLLNEKKQAVISKVVTRGLDPNAELVDSGVDWIGKVPRGWRIDALKHSLDILPGYAFPSDDFNAANGIRLLRGVNVAVGGLRWEEVVYWNKEILPVMRPFVLEEGDLIVGLDRPWISDGTRVAFVTKKDLPALLVQRVCRIRKTGSVDLRYVYLWLASVAFERSLTTETTGISVPHISTKQIGDFKIAIPPLSEQREIVAYLDAEGAKTDKAIAAVTRQIGLLREYRTRLISDAVTGRIDLRRGGGK